MFIRPTVFLARECMCVVPLTRLRRYRLNGRYSAANWAADQLTFIEFALVHILTVFQFRCSHAASSGAPGRLLLTRFAHTIGDFANYCLRTPEPTSVVICVGIWATAFLACLKFFPGLFWEDILGAAAPTLTRIPRSGEQVAAWDAYMRAIL